MLAYHHSTLLNGVIRQVLHQPTIVVSPFPCPPFTPPWLQPTVFHTPAMRRFCMMQAEAHNVVSVVASAAEGYPFVPPEWAPSVLVPLTGLVMPAVAMAWAFQYISQEKQA